MCGRYTITSPLDAIRALFNVDERPNLAPRFNVAPTQLVPVVRPGDTPSGRALVQLRWGLIPHWAKDARIGAKMINARAETVADTAAFREAYAKRRCLIVADGFYEWRRDGKQKQPFRFVLADGGPFAFAGLWSRWRDPAGETIESCTIITTAANAVVAPIHARMPVILAPDNYARWLDPANDARPLLRPFPAEALTAYPVSPRVNAVRNDDAGLIERAAEQATLL